MYAVCSEVSVKCQCKQFNLSRMVILTVKEPNQEKQKKKKKKKKKKTAGYSAPLEL